MPVFILPGSLHDHSKRPPGWMPRACFILCRRRFTFLLGRTAITTLRYRPVIQTIVSFIRVRCFSCPEGFRLRPRGTWGEVACVLSRSARRGASGTAPSPLLAGHHPLPSDPRNGYHDPGSRTPGLNVLFTVLLGADLAATVRIDCATALGCHLRQAAGTPRVATDRWIASSSTCARLAPWMRATGWVRRGGAQAAGFRNGPEQCG